MRKKIKLSVILFGAFLLVKILFNDINSPDILRYKAWRFIYKNRYISILFFSKKTKKIENNIPGVEIRAPLVVNAQANEKKIIYYKGKKITILATDASQDTPEFLLEFFYQLELAKERNQQK